MIKRKIFNQVIKGLSRQAAVALIGPRQVGKTTLALEVAEMKDSIYLDLETPQDRAKLSEPVLFLQKYEDKLVILDEIHRAPEIFQSLRGLIDQGRRKGKRYGRFLILGSATIDLLRQSGESLAGRIEYINMSPLTCLETDKSKIDDLWIRGGFPDSFLAQNDKNSFKWRKNFILTYLERDVPQFGPRIPAETLSRLWTMLAHNQGGLLNSSRLASAFSISAPTVTAYVDLLADLLLLRRLQPLHTNIGKRLVKSPKVYVRDSGLLHALLDIENYNSLSGHPVNGPSYEGFVIENIIANLPENTSPTFYRTASGAEIDLVIDMPTNRKRIAIEVKRSLSPKPDKGFHIACQDIKVTNKYVVYPGKDRYPIGQDTEAISLTELAQEIIA
jgi:predicted AAA+ superfamily ATPase